LHKSEGESLGRRYIENLILEKLGLVGHVQDGTGMETAQDGIQHGMETAQDGVQHGMETTGPADVPPPPKRHCSSISEQLDISTELI
jgi:hypothetical protein